MIFTPSDTNYAPIIVNVDVDTYSTSGAISLTHYTVRFDNDGGNAIANQNVSKNNKATEPRAPVKDGYVFDGWYTDSEFASEYNFDTKITGDITLYAKWIEDEAQTLSGASGGGMQNSIMDEWENPFADVVKSDYFF